MRRRRDTRLDTAGARLAAYEEALMDEFVDMSKKEVEAKDDTTDPVNHPAHYNFGKYEPIDVIEDWGLGFCLGNTVKYISRAGRKDPAKTVEDLKKARFYLDREIKRLEELDAKSAG